MSLDFEALLARSVELRAFHTGWKRSFLSSDYVTMSCSLKVTTAWLHHFIASEGNSRRFALTRRPLFFDALFEYSF